MIESGPCVPTLLGAGPQKGIRETINNDTRFIILICHPIHWIFMLSCAVNIGVSVIS